MALGRRITDLRLKAGQSLQAVADAVGVSKAHVGNWRKERPTIHPCGWWSDWPIISEYQSLF